MLSNVRLPNLTIRSWVILGIAATGTVLGLLAVKGCTRIASAREMATGMRGKSSGALAKLTEHAPASAVGRKRFVRTDDVIDLEHLAHERPTQSNLQKLADAYLGVGDFNRAAKTYYKLANLFNERGDENSALAEIRTAQQYETKTGIFAEQETDPADVESNFTAARLEPKYGCYNGAFIDHETTLKQHMLDGSPRRDVGEFNRRTGTQHATYFIYLGYGKPFPKEWVAHLKANHAMAQLAFEPTSYDQVKDDHYLRQFARDAKASGVPIFLRFASEMNGDWVAYHPSPEKYIAMFRLVAQVMHEETENVAMVWCPFEIPQRYIKPYYPGKDAVDWVGINVYSVLYNDNDPGRNAQERNPADALKYIYHEYAKVHPIMIGEFGAAKMSSLDMVPRSDYAIMKLQQLYTCLPLLYPRVKAVHWLSMNAIQHADPGRQLNDYSLLEDLDVAEAYRDANASPYFLKQYAPQAAATIEYKRLSDGDDVHEVVQLRGWVKSYTNLPTVVWLVDGKEIGRSSSPGMYPVEWDTRQHANGQANLELVVLDRLGYEIKRESISVRVSN